MSVAKDLQHLQRRFAAHSHDGSAKALVKHSDVTDALNDAQRAANLFAEFDSDGDQNLDGDEFLAMMPAAMHARFSSEEMRP